MRMIAVLLICMLCSQSSLRAHNYAANLPSSARLMLNKRFPGWKFAEVSREVQQVFDDDRKDASPSLISGDFDGNGKLDYATLIQRGVVRNGDGKAIGPRLFLVVFLQKGVAHRREG